ncbi:type IV toxin-antitoxin system AbiEi family antitoxin domain-containing protein [Aeromicrobium duanguangcaii]|uniref:type IV toxin-antitoxin system AbiEi family antitoxin domain-containing protein n=1 Tax=Aeromicrobium duanguangcaii TaxID=2968086 RepID=UPI0020180137|nr:type IV toxin-antitoxin system AbiEi family antitoxin domain-containing protein [Aeromicrobium duanguangcaii]MCL3838377.1 type IV toxin-antitoxin system AbiEi family antitoxin domain-containing protein [Aeromicrobium duanguangcaii]
MLPPHQDGVISRSQLLAEGRTPNDVRRLLRRGELRAVAPGVYVDHTGPLTWRQRAWAAVLWAWPAALCAESALEAAHGSAERENGSIHVAVDHSRRLTAPPAGITVIRMRDFEPRVHWHLSPPRLAYDEAVLDVACGATRLVDQVAVLAAAVGERRTTAARLRGRLDARSRVADRRRIERLLTDIELGTHSVLEHG